MACPSAMYTRHMRLARWRLGRHSRSASTAAAIKPRAAASASESTAGGAALSKWARPLPPPPPVPTSQRQTGSSSASAPSKWARPPPPPPPPTQARPAAPSHAQAAHAHNMSNQAPARSASPAPGAHAPNAAAPASPALLPNLSKWAAPPPRSPSQDVRPAPQASAPPPPSKWARPASPAARAAPAPAAAPSASASSWGRSPAPHMASVTTPAAPGLSKWARPAPQAPAPAHSRPDARTRAPRDEPRPFGLRQPGAEPAQARSRGPAGPAMRPRGTGAADAYLGHSDDAADADKRARAHDARRARGSALDRVREAHDNGGAAAAAPAPARRVHKAKTIRAAPVDVFLPSVCSAEHLARLLGVRLDALQRAMARAGMADEAKHGDLLTAEYAGLLALEFDRNPVVSDEKAFDVHPPPAPADMSKLPPRPPVVTIMGHVDHGKTTLLDSLRSASVAAGEAGGITQHIGAFSVSVGKGADARAITFLDTPGHAAFAAMRARGARATDVVVLVVAADDGVMPQTREVIELVKRDEGKVGLVVAINKCDKPGADVDKVQRELLVEGIQLEEFGGDVPSVQVSGLTGTGLDTLVETISALAELQDLRAERDGPVYGHVLESRVQKGLGAVATVLVLRGCLKPGMHVLCGTTTAKVRAMADGAGKSVRAAYPGDAVTVAGWKEVPAVGAEALSTSETDAKRALANRLRAAQALASLGDLEAINAARRTERDAREAEERADAARAQGLAAPDAPPAAEARKELRLVVKGDVSGSVEAVAGALEGIGNPRAGVKIVHTGVGDVSESDVQLAQTAEGVVVAFGVAVPRGVAQLAAHAGVPIAASPIIYQLMDDVKARVVALLPTIREARVAGEAAVLQLFEIQGKGKQTVRVAGCRVTNGLLAKDKPARVVRAGETIFTGPVDTLRHLKKDVTEVRKGMECGLSVRGFDDIREGDTLQFIEIVEKPGQL